MWSVTAASPTDASGFIPTIARRALKHVIDTGRRYGTTKFGIQLAHAGRKASAQRPWDGGGRLEAGRGPLGDHCAVRPAVRSGLARARGK